MTPAELALVRPLIERALEEDIGSGDLTSMALVDPLARASGEYVTREEIVVCGLPLVHEVARILDPELRCRSLVSDGTLVPAGAVLAQVEGGARSILAAERTSLNFLQRLTGIATATRSYVRRLPDASTRILDTRKTVPGYRPLDRYAVRSGGGSNHRNGLFDAILIKDNHLIFCGGPGDAVRRARLHAGESVFIEVEVQSMEELREAIDSGADRILIDNFDPSEAREAVRIAGGRVPLEASGGITLETVGAYAGAGVDYISIGALTHSVRAADIHLALTSG
jgi:nicotinate-nucleotide pyrophosphorylase (carboxylating)